MDSQFASQVVGFITLFIFLLIPLALIFLANLGETQGWARILTFLGTALLAALGALYGVAVAGMGLMSTMNPDMPAGLLPISPLTGLLIGAIMLGTSVVALIPFIPPVRRGLARVLPLRPESFVGSFALALAIMAVGYSVASLPLAQTLATPESQASLDASLSLPALWLQGIMFAVYGFVGVGLGLRRGFRATLERLGLGRLTLRFLAVAVAAWLGLLMLDFFVSAIWRALAPGAYQEFGRLTEALFGRFISVPGAITLGLSAGIGEEILFRGALQPRLGILLTSFLFMIVHAQYGLTPALFQIFIVGVALGLIRKYANTTTCIVVHALFNAGSVLLSLLFPNSF